MPAPVNHFLITMIRLRDYQEKFKAAIYKAWAMFMSVLAVLPTGGGKTVVFSALINEHHGASAAIVHRKEILGQISLALGKLEVKHRVVAPDDVVGMIRRKHLKAFNKSFIDPGSKTGVISVQTLTSKSSEKNSALQAWLRQITLAVFDEGHHYIKKGLWGKAPEAVPNAKLLFVTATPERADGKGLGAHADGFAETIVEGPSTKWLMEQGYLSGFIYKCPETDLDLHDIPLTKDGDLNTKAMRKRIIDSRFVGDTIDHYFKYAAGKKTIIFANDVDTAREIEAGLRKEGVKAAELNGNSDTTVRDRKLEEFEFGDLQVLINVDLFDEGFDVAGVEAVIMARKTESLAKYLQMIGRALRVVYAPGYDLSTQEGRLAAIAAGGKLKAIIVDPVGNWERHGAPVWPRRWSLDGRGEGGSRSRMIPQRVCLECTSPYEKILSACPFCGAEAPKPEPGKRSIPEQVDGDLMELDEKGMAELFERINGANMSDEEFKLDVIKRNVPPAGRQRLLAKHQEDKYRRKVLEELLGWWVGMQQQQGREMPEIYKRFYFRFGVDMGTAKTLKAKETDALIEDLTAHFNEDVAPC